MCAHLKTLYGVEFAFMFFSYVLLGEGHQTVLWANMFGDLQVLFLIPINSLLLYSSDHCPLNALPYHGIHILLYLRTMVFSNIHHVFWSSWHIINLKHLISSSKSENASPTPHFKSLIPIINNALTSWHFPFLGF